MSGLIGHLNKNYENFYLARLESLEALNQTLLLAKKYQEILTEKQCFIFEVTDDFKAQVVEFDAEEVEVGPKKETALQSCDTKALKILMAKHITSLGHIAMGYKEATEKCRLAYENLRQAMCPSKSLDEGKREITDKPLVLVGVPSKPTSCKPRDESKSLKRSVSQRLHAKLKKGALLEMPFLNTIEKIETKARETYISRGDTYRKVVAKLIAEPLRVEKMVAQSLRLSEPGSYHFNEPKMQCVIF